MNNTAAPTTTLPTYRCGGCLSTSFHNDECDECSKPVPVACRLIVKQAMWAVAA